MVALSSTWQEIEWWEDSTNDPNQKVRWRVIARCEEDVADNSSDVYFYVQKRITNGSAGWAEYPVTKSMVITGTGASSDSHRASMSWTFGRTTSTEWADADGNFSDAYWSNVKHNSDGTLTIRAHITGDRVVSGSIDTYVDLVLPTIPRASIPTTNKSSITLDGVNSMIITTNRKSSNFTHTLTFVSGSASLTVNNVGSSYTWLPSMSRWGDRVWSVTNATVTITCTTYSGSTQIGSPQSITVTLKKDTRASTAKFDKTAIVLDGTNKFTLTITRAISAFTHTVTYKQAGATDFVVENVGTSTQFQPGVSRMAYCSAVKNPVTVTLSTYNAGFKVGSTKTYTIYLNVDTSVYKPTIGTISVTENNSSVSSVMGGNGFVKLLSNITASIPYGVSDSNYVTLASGTAVLGSQQTQNYTLSGTSQTKSLTQSKLTATSLVATVKDTRGVSASKTKTLTVRDYSLISIVSTSVQRTNSSGTPSSSGTYCKYTVKVSCHTGSYNGQNNTITLQWRYKKHSSSTWSAWTTLSTTDTGSGTGTTTTYSLSRTVGQGTLQNVQYDIQFRATDLFVTDTSPNMILYEGIPVYSWGADHFDVYGTLHIHDRDDPAKFTTIGAVGYMPPSVTLTDCDDATQYGVRYIANADTVNKPTSSGWYQLYVFPQGANYRTQIAFLTNTQGSRIFVRSNNDNGWGAWRELAEYIANPLTTQAYTSASVSCSANSTGSTTISVTVPTGYKFVGIMETWSNGAVVPSYSNNTVLSNGSVTVYWMNPTASAITCTFSVNVLFTKL